jgi:hypothetical protein
MNSNVASHGRVTVRIPTPAGDEIDAWPYTPEEATRPHQSIGVAY